MNWSTPDLADQHPDEISAVELQMVSYGLPKTFHGPIATVKCFEDNSKVKELAQEAGNGRVMVVDGGGSIRKALMGDMIAETAMNNGWAGAVIFGVIRDVEIINTLDFGVKCLGSIPLKTDKLGQGQTGINVSFGNTVFTEQQFLYSDANGILVSDSSLI